LRTPQIFVIRNITFITSIAIALMTPFHHPRIKPNHQRELRKALTVQSRIAFQ
jgi:hypothetical protein